MLKRFFCCLLLVVMTVTSVCAEDWMSGTDQPGAVDIMNEDVIYDAADSVGTVVNGDNPDPTEAEKIVYSFTPLDVVLVLDVSGSMGTINEATNKNLRDYANEAANVFTDSLFAVNPASRIGVVFFDDSVSIASDMRGISQHQDLTAAINRMYCGGGTNTGGGFQAAANMLQTSAMPGRRCMVLMITDGLANSGAYDYLQYAIDQGGQAAQYGNVYTIGLVGGMGDYDKKTARRVLGGGYETRYFEVDFDSVGDMGTALASIMTTLPVVVSANESLDDSGLLEEMSTYRLTVGSGYSATITAGGEQLSSAADQYSTTASFGSMSVVDGKQTFIMVNGDYDIDLQGVTAGKGDYTITEIAGLSLTEKPVVSSKEWTIRSVHKKLNIHESQVTVTDLSYNPLDITGTDDKGQPVLGQEVLAGAYVNGTVNVYSAPHKNAETIAKVPTTGRVKIIAADPATEYSFISMTDDKGFVRRGWMKTSALRNPEGVIPQMVWLSGSFTVPADTVTYFAPDTRAAQAYQVTAGSVVELKFVDRDFQGNEWAYVAVPGKKNQHRYAYIPAAALENWQTLTAEGFRIGSLDPVIDPTIEFIEMTDVIPAQKLPIFSGPSKNAWRGANNKAMVSTNGALYAAGWVDNDWLLVQYETSGTNRRTGYVASSSIKDNFSHLPQLNFANTPATVVVECVLTDDPINSSDQIVTLAPGTQVTYLAELAGIRGGQAFHYVETTVKNKAVRGFIPVGTITK